jgi:uncharacterized protein YceH (UPF0502 family)
VSTPRRESLDLRSGFASIVTHSTRAIIASADEEAAEAEAEAEVARLREELARLQLRLGGDAPR